MLLTAMVLLVLLSGCATYGKVLLEPRTGSYMTIEKLEENWDQYTVHSTDYWREGNPGGILFDPKDDQNTLTSGAWREVGDQQSLSQLINSIQGSRGRLYRIIGPEDEIFGYLYMYVKPNRVKFFVKVIDQNELWVSGIEPQILGVP